MSDTITIINQSLLNDTLEPVGHCWKFAVFEASVKDASIVTGTARCEPENATVTVANGFCKDGECPFNTLNLLPAWMRR